MYTLGFVGTAKNTGKTTTALYMLNLVLSEGYRVALTSIGYDGENTDHITGLPKPRYFVNPGVVVATAERCLEYGTAAYSEVLPTGIHTILGEIVIATVATAGNVVLAGPNRKIDIFPLLQQLQDLGMEITFLDGALNRLAAMTMVDGLILSTGAAYDSRIPVIADHISAMQTLFPHPRYDESFVFKDGLVQFVNQNHSISKLNSGSVLDENSLKTVTGWLSTKGAGQCYIPGIFNPQLFQNMIQSIKPTLQQKSFIFASPLNLLTSSQPDLWRSNFDTLVNNGASIYYTQPIHLNFITVNPFYPRYLQKTASYVAEFVDKHELLKSVRDQINNTLVVDIMLPPLPDLLSMCHLPPKRRTQ